MEEFDAFWRLYTRDKKKRGNGKGWDAGKKVALAIRVETDGELRDARHRCPAPRTAHFQIAPVRGSVKVVTYEIFSGHPDEDARWLGIVDGLSNAFERMHRLAQVSPGMYFIYGAGKVLASIDTTAEQASESPRPSADASPRRASIPHSASALPTPRKSPRRD